MSPSSKAHSKSGMPYHSVSELVEDAPASESMNNQVLLSRLLCRHLQRALRLVGLEIAGEMSTIDSFAFLGTQHSADKLIGRRRHRRKYEQLESYARNEPRIELIKRSLERVLRYGTFFSNGTALSAVDCFRWVNLRYWAHYDTGTIQDNIGALSSYCNCDCEFCFEAGNRAAGLPFGRKMLSVQEVATRVKYYSNDTHKGLVGASSFGLETFLNPRTLDIIELIRAVDPDYCIGFVTNGTFLTEDVVSRLAKAQPFFISLSLNASSPEIWQQTMRGRPDGVAEIPFRALELLKKYGIPTVSSYVPWPSKPISDLEDAVLYMDEMDVIRARICLPTFTRFHSQEPPFDPQTYWTEVLDAVRSVRQKVRIPVSFMPALFEFNTSLPIVHGTLKGSPAEKAGIRFGDRILAIDGEEVFTISQTRGLLRRRVSDPEIISTTYTIQRDNELSNINIPHKAQNTSDYPYSALVRWRHRKYIEALGVYLVEGFPITHIVSLAEICEEFIGKRILLFTSAPMEPHLKEAISMVDRMVQLLDLLELFIEKPYHSFFGGNVIIADLWMVSDLIEYTRNWMSKTGIRPDVVIAPSSFLSTGKRDLLGDYYLKFERELDIELRLISCTAFSDI